MKQLYNSPPPGVEACNLSKTFGTVRALSDVSVRFQSGRLHALLGENGAGKSTLVKCLMGYYEAEEGSVVVDGRPHQMRSPQDSQALGMGMVYQHFTVVDRMTVAENLVLGRTDIPFSIDWKSEIAALRDFMNAMPFQIDPERRVSSLAAGEKQKLEILKQLYLGRRFIVLDEPTSVLTPGEADQVLSEMRRLADERMLTVAMITHKFREVADFAQDVTIMRAGRVVVSEQVSSASEKHLARLMFGEGSTFKIASKRAPELNQASKDFLMISGVKAIGDRGTEVVSGATLSVSKGEIVGVAGVSGNGQKQLVEVFAGQREMTEGAISVNGAPYRRTRAEMQREGIFLLTEEPLQNVCVRTMSVMDNLALRRFDQAPIARYGWLNRKVLRSWAHSLILKYRIKAASEASRIDTLSGGNVQRVVLARELSDGVQLLVMQNPCFGLDAQSAAEIRSQIIDARNRGAAVLLFSEDLDEILELSDRITVMSSGQMVYEVNSENADRYEIGRHMTHSTAKSSGHMVS
jgi:ABC-type uncharacterized transport system ATPase subunit